MKSLLCCPFRLFPVKKIVVYEHPLQQHFHRSVSSEEEEEREKKNICLFSKYWTDLLSYYDAVKIRLKKQDINCFFPFFIYMSLYL